VLLALLIYSYRRFGRRDGVTGTKAAVAELIRERPDVRG
jgi:hypothetical protein